MYVKPQARGMNSILTEIGSHVSRWMNTWGRFKKRKILLKYFDPNNKDEWKLFHSGSYDFSISIKWQFFIPFNQ